MTPAQRRDFELIARGLVVQAAPKRGGADAFGPVMVPDWYVPLPVHMQWCDWCSEQALAEEP